MHKGMKFIDAHVHMYKLGGIPSIMHTLRSASYDAVNLLSLTQYDKQYMAQNVVGLALKALYPTKVYLFGALHHHLPGAPAADRDYAAQARCLIAAGCDGMKMLEGKPNARKRIGLALNDSLLYGFYDFMQSRGLPILCHAMDPEICWDLERCPDYFRDAGYCYDGSYPSKAEISNEILSMVKRFPKLKIIFAHFFFISADLAAARRLLDEHPNVMLDITPGGEMYVSFAAQRDAWREFFITYQDRIVYGTDTCDGPEPAPDAPEGTPENVGAILRFLETSDTFPKWHDVWQGLELPQKAVAKIIGGNFQRCAGVTIKPLDLTRCLEYGQWVLAYARRSEEREAILPDLELALERLQGLQAGKV
jgi:predicted TIM-barrel fold metal-dependent hydrolase